MKSSGQEAWPSDRRWEQPWEESINAEAPAPPRGPRSRACIFQRPPGGDTLVWKPKSCFQSC